MATVGRRLKVEFTQDKCIGNGACIVASHDFKFLENENKAELKGSCRQGKLMVLEKIFSKPEHLINAANSCPVNAIRVLDAESGEEVVGVEVKQDKVKEIEASYDDIKEFVMDPKGYFLIRINPKKGHIEVGFCRELNKVAVTVTGTKPLEIYQVIIKNGLVSRLDHAAYLGRELQKAYIALTQKMKYVQDDELEFAANTA
ncbi:MAG: DUF4346 domain-containing protein [Nanoarchaeota archaeon]